MAITAADRMIKPSVGVLTASVRFHGQVIEAIDLKLERPLQVLAGLHGKRPPDCLRLLPLLFPLCGTAHALAALQAIEAAASVVPEPVHASARSALAMADRLAAEVWRTCIDWALLTQTPAQPRPVAQARRLVERIARAIYPDGDWQRIGGGRLAPDAIGLATVRDELRQLQGQLDLADVHAALRAQMAVALSGAAPPWTARLDACFAEMIEATSTSFRMLDAQLEVMLGLPATPPASVEQTIQTGRGIGIAPTARGELCYEFDINGGQIQTCRMSAPTDRVFGSDGPVVQLLQQLQHANDPLLAVRWVLAAYDPCLEVQVNAVGA